MPSDPSGSRRRNDIQHEALPKGPNCKEGYMKRTVAMLFAGLLLVQSSAFAADAEQKELGGFQEKRVEKLAKDLSLSPDQKQKVSAIFSQTANEIKAELAKIKSIKDAADQKMKEALSPEQYQKYEKMKAERKSQMKKKMKGAMQGQDGQEK